jgi:hypothetical protein
MVALSATFTLIRFRPQPRDCYAGEATFCCPSGRVARAAVYRSYGTLYFGPATADPDLFSGGSLEHEVQQGLRAALRHCCPELFVAEDAQ